MPGFSSCCCWNGGTLNTAEISPPPLSSAMVDSGGVIDTVRESSLAKLACPNALAAAIWSAIACTGTCAAAGRDAASATAPAAQRNAIQFIVSSWKASSLDGAAERLHQSGITRQVVLEEAGEALDRPSRHLVAEGSEMPVELRLAHD